MNFFKGFLIILIFVNGLEYSYQQRDEHQTYCEGPYDPPNPGASVKHESGRPRVLPFCMWKDMNNQWPTHPDFPVEWRRLLEKVAIQLDFNSGRKYNVELLHNSKMEAHKSMQITMSLIEDSAKNIYQRRILLEIKFRHLKNEGYEGVYIQAIKAPLGIPFGEFVLTPVEKAGAEFRSLPQNLAKSVPCFFTTHSDKEAQVLVSKFGPKGTPTAAPGDSFQVQFKWKDVPCSETFLFQFLIVVVKKFDASRSVTRISEIFQVLPFKFDSLGTTTADGQGFFKGKTINAVSMDGVVNKPITNRIVINPHYDLCVFRGENQDASRICPPGPFDCDQPLSTEADIRKEYLKLFKVYKKFDANQERAYCENTALPPTTTTTTPTPSTTKTRRTTSKTTAPPPPVRTPAPPPPPTLVDNITESVAKVAEKVEKKTIISHSDLATYVWFVSIPFVNYLARYFKELTPCSKFHLGLWIVAHFVGHHLAVFLMWISFGLVLSTGDEFFGKCGVGHFWFGLIAVMIQHIILFESSIGSVDEEGDRDRMKSVKHKPAIHVGLSHLASLCAFCSIFNVNRAGILITFVLSMSGINIIALIVAGVIDRKMEKALHVIPRRRWFPDLEQIVLVRQTQVKPYTTYKIIFTVFYFVLIHGIYLYFVLSSAI